MIMADTKPIPPADASDDTATLRAQLEAATAEVARLKDIAGRAQADLQNAKQRLEREANDLRVFANEKFMLSILPILDSFQRAMKHVPEDLKGNEWVKGMLATEKDLMDRLRDMGLSRFDSVGAKADPKTEEVLMTGPGEEGVVTEMLEDGYALHNKVLRPAKVKVGDGTGIAA